MISNRATTFMVTTVIFQLKINHSQLSSSLIKIIDHALGVKKDNIVLKYIIIQFVRIIDSDRFIMRWSSVYYEMSSFWKLNTGFLNIQVVLCRIAMEQEF